MDHQYWRQRPQIQFLSGLLVLLAVRTIPRTRKSTDFKTQQRNCTIWHILNWASQRRAHVSPAHHGSSAPSFSLVVKSSMQSFSLKKAFFWGLYSMLSCFSKSFQSIPHNRWTISLMGIWSFHEWRRCVFSSFTSVTVSSKYFFFISGSQSRER